MKRLALLVGLTLLTVVGTTATTQAYYLDTPHNESNGIYCYTCHGGTIGSVWWGYTSSGPDDTMRNAICLQCHDEASSDPRKGPAKMLHASSTTSTNYGTWSTECTQCHDVHSQGQLDWAGVDDAALFLAQGVFNTGVAVRSFNPTDPAGGGYGATTIGIGSVTGQAGWTDTTTWGAKGGKMDPTRATDLSRGLILVPNKATPTETFEIISVVANVIKVKGNMTVAPNGQTFGVIYGQGLKSYLLPNGGTTVNDYRDVKFFKPEIVAGTYGGYIDETPAATAPTGLCQVCHDITSYWNNNGANATHNAGTTCGTCHNVLTGGAGGANHTLKVDNHFDNITYAPKIVDCAICHDPSDTPGLHALAVNLAAGSGCEACHSVGQTALNADVAARLGVTPQFGDDGTWPVTCAACHPTKPAAVAGGTHGGHPGTDFAWDGNCADCHSATPLAPTEEVVLNIHGNVCVTCHDPAAVAANNYTVRRVGDATNGIDGDASTATVASTCTGCHNVNTPGVVHHDSAGGQAAAGNCEFCHATSGHEGNHTALIADYVNCTNCHNANVGTVTGAPVNATDPKKHDACVTCHNVDGTLKTLVQVGGSKVIAMPNGGAGTNNGGGTCAACHGEYFSNHTNINHTSKIGAAATCVSCHTGTAGTATAAPVNPADNMIHDACTVCHNANGSRRTAYGYAVAMPAGGGLCTDCHGAYFPNHQPVDHATLVADTVNCNTCHTGTAGLVTGMPVNPADPKVHDACNTCHDDLINNLLRTPYGKASAMMAGDCNACHGAYFSSHVNVNHTTKVAASTSCNSTACHTATAGNATTVPVSTIDNKVHDACADCHNPTTGAYLAAYGWASAMPAGGGDCVACHGAYFENHVASNHATRVAALATCTDSCHTATAGDAVTVPVSPFDDKKHDSCFTCHTADGPLKAAYGYASAMPAGGGNCGTCHGAGYFDSHVHGTTGGYVTHDVAYNATVDTSQVTAVPCANCHVPATAGTLTTWAGILEEHVTGCARCHSYTNGDGQNSPPLATNTNTIASGTGVTCVTCHTEKKDTNHGGHDAGDFDWDAACMPCHGDGTQSVVQTIHLDSCIMCHTTSSGGTGTARAGSAVNAANGIDADPSLGVGAAPHTGVTCLTCHDVADADVNADSLGGMHHDNKNSNTTCTNANCHGTSVAHTNTVKVDPTAICDDCHAATADGKLAPDAITSPYTGAGEAHNANGCATCHTFNAAPGMGGILKAAYGKATVLSNNATAAWVNGTDGGGFCTACHYTANGTYGFLHHDTAQAAGNNCLATCHSNTVYTNKAVDHSNTVKDIAAGWTTSPNGCDTCHTGVVGTTTQAPVNPTSGIVHDSCRTCHTFDASGYGILVTQATTRKGITAGTNLQTTAGAGTIGSTDGGGACTVCHSTISNLTTSGSMHHSDTGGHTAIGECEYCHDDPRNDTIAGFEETAPAGGIPTHLPCKECHVTPETTTNWGTTLTIYSFNEGSETQKSASRWNVDYTRTIANTNNHTVATTAGQINNWGMCFSCHDGSKAVSVTPLHATPTNYVATNLSLTPAGASSGWAAYLPGRAISNNMGNFNFLASSYRPASTRPGIDTFEGRIITNAVTQWSTAIKYSYTLDGGTATDTSIPDPYTTSTVVVPMFGAVTAQSTTTPVADNIIVISAVYTGSTDDLVVTATSTGACGNLTARYLADGSTESATQVMSGVSPNCTGTLLNLATNPTAGVSKLNVTTTADGINVTNFPVTLVP